MSGSTEINARSLRAGTTMVGRTYQGALTRVSGIAFWTCGHEHESQHDALVCACEEQLRMLRRKPRSAVTE